MLTPQSNTTLKEIAQVISQHNTFAVCGHVNPDGDCLGAQLALVHGLRAMGKTATGLLATSEPIQDKLQFLPGVFDLVPGSDFTEDVEVFIAVDVPTTERMKTAAQVHNRAPITITIDHHAWEEAVSQYNYVDPASPSTCDLVWDLLKILGCVGQPQALCVLTGIMTDTGRFSYQNTNPTCLIHAAETLEFGASSALVAREFFQSRSLPSLRLEQVMLSRMEFFCEGQFVFSYIKDSDFAAAGAIKDDAEILIDILRNIAGIRVALLLKENGPGEVRGSLRSKDSTNVAVVAYEYGGGGHIPAAGLTFKGSLFDAVESVIETTLRLCFPKAAPAEQAHLATFLEQQKASLNG